MKPQTPPGVTTVQPTSRCSPLTRSWLIAVTRNSTRSLPPGLYQVTAALVVDGATLAAFSAPRGRTTQEGLGVGVTAGVVEGNGRNPLAYGLGVPGARTAPRGGGARPAPGGGPPRRWAPSPQGEPLGSGTAPALVLLDPQPLSSGASSSTD